MRHIPQLQRCGCKYAVSYLPAIDNGTKCHRSRVSRRRIISAGGRLGRLIRLPLQDGMAGCEAEPSPAVFAPIRSGAQLSGLIMPVPANGQDRDRVGMKF